ncbi:MAG: hypothetical protein HN805_08725 [Rhodobacteraceae bacterium]|nr:hypothetical protein [Paracoccaceae bacterium]
MSRRLQLIAPVEARPVVIARAAMRPQVCSRSATRPIAVMAKLVLSLAWILCQARVFDTVPRRDP